MAVSDACSIQIHGVEHTPSVMPTLTKWAGEVGQGLGLEAGVDEVWMSCICARGPAGPDLLLGQANTFGVEPVIALVCAVRGRA